MLKKRFVSKTHEGNVMLETSTYPLSAVYTAVLNEN